MALVSNPKDGDDVSVRQAIARLSSSKLGPTSTPKFLGVTTTSLTISGLTASRLIATDASKGVVSSDLVGWVAGTSNQIIVADDSDGSITLSTPQDIHTEANPTFIGIICKDSGDNVYLSADEDIFYIEAK